MSAETFEDTLKTFKRFQSDFDETKETINGFKSEWQKYLRFCDDIDIQANDFDKKFQIDTAEKFWQNNYIAFPHLHKLARFVMTFAPSSGAPERVFSVLKSNFTLAQLRSTLQD